MLSNAPSRSSMMPESPLKRERGLRIPKAKRKRDCPYERVRSSMWKEKQKTNRENEAGITDNKAEGDVNRPKVKSASVPGSAQSSTSSPDAYTLENKRGKGRYGRGQQGWKRDAGSRHR